MRLKGYYTMSIESNKLEQKPKDTTTRRKCEVEVFSRVCGFFRPVQNWNPGKQQEHSEKKTYKI